MGTQGILMQLVSSARVSGITKRNLRDLVDRQFIIEVLTEKKFNQCKAAIALGMHRNSLNREMKRLGINVQMLKKKTPMRETLAHRPQISVNQ